jgi:hypothetical protein
VSNLCLIRLHPDAECYEEIPVPILTDEISVLFEERKKEISI